MQKVVKFIAQVYTIQNFAKFLQQSIETQCTDEKISTVFFKNLPQKVPTLFLFQLLMVLHILPMQQKHLGYGTIRSFGSCVYINKKYSWFWWMQCNSLHQDQLK